MAWLNLPNALTLSRLGLGVGVFILVHRAAALVGTALPDRSASEEAARLLDLALALFGVASLTDWLDGLIARRYNLLTDFGRVADPFVDKVLVCGVFVLLVPIEAAWVRPWMVVALVAREFLVSALRGYLESRGRAFGAMAWGKWKMAVQCGAIGYLFFYLAHLQGSRPAEALAAGAVWFTVILTVGSGAAYLARAVRVLAATRGP